MLSGRALLLQSPEVLRGQGVDNHATTLPAGGDVNQHAVCPCSYVWREGQYWQVPASRAGVFRDSTLKPPEKRLLMRFMQKLQQHAMASQEEQKACFLCPGSARLISSPSRS